MLKRHNRTRRKLKRRCEQQKWRKTSLTIYRVLDFHILNRFKDRLLAHKKQKMGSKRLQKDDKLYNRSRTRLKSNYYEEEEDLIDVQNIEEQSKEQVYKLQEKKKVYEQKCSRKYFLLGLQYLQKKRGIKNILSAFKKRRRNKRRY